MYFCSFMLSLLCAISLVNNCKAGGKAGGKAATKVGLAGVATAGVSYGDSNAFQVSSATGLYGHHNGTFDGKPKNVLDLLKYELMIHRAYDVNLRPVIDPNSTVNVSVDFTTRQVLDLDEKNQVLKIYLHYRLFWMDEFLKWNPTDFDGIESIWLSSTAIWRPDVVVYEDTVNRDYTPRIPFVKVDYNGQVTYLEPVVFETSCSVNIAHFPFDKQICTLTLTSWTFPTKKVDVSARRSAKNMNKDIDKFLIKTGEWTLENIEIKKRSQNYGDVLGGDDGHTHLNFDSTTATGPFSNDSLNAKNFFMTPTATVESVAPSRVTELHWSEVVYTIHIGRSSVLYIQSMVFPAILLTTIALFGFYLPPDSGERIGLQITILLTFMVFLITVGEMFTASSIGPYLGLYYVVCMGLLGVNLFMTVLVLHIHYMPPEALVQETKPNGELVLKQPAGWIRFVLRATEMMVRSNCWNRKRYPRCSLTRTIRRHSKKKKSSTQASNSNSNSMDDIPDSINEEDVQEVTVENGLKHSSPDVIENGIPMTMLEKNLDSRELYDSDLGGVRLRLNGENDKPNKMYKPGEDEVSLAQNFNILHNINNSVGEMVKYLQEENSDLVQRNNLGEIADEWKAIARIVDDICLRLYLALLIVCHIIILVVALVF